MTEIPEYLLKHPVVIARARESAKRSEADNYNSLHGDDSAANATARFILGLHTRSQDTDSSASTTSRADITGTGAIIDYESPEVCSLASAKIRHAAVKALSTEDSIDTKYREVIIGEDGAIQLRSAEKSRLAFGFGRVNDYNGVRFAVWTDYVRPSLFKKNMPQDVIEKQNLFFGTVSWSQESGQRLYIPLLTSIKTSNGCRFVLPVMQEQTDTNYNLPDILKQLDVCIGTCSDANVRNLTKTTAEAVKAQDLSLNSLAFDNLRGIVDAVTTDDAEQVALRQTVALLRAKNSTSQKIRTKDNEWHDLDVLFTKNGVQTVVGNNTLSLVFTVAADGVYQYEDGTFCSRWAIWSGTDEAVYGKDVAFQVPRYVIESDEYGRVSIMRYCDDLTTLEDVTSADEKDFILKEVITQSRQ